MEITTIIGWFGTLTPPELRQAVEQICREGQALIAQIEEWRQPTYGVVETKAVPGGCYRLEYVKCGKESCKCVSGEGHGPYWYKYSYRQGGGQRKTYIGKQRPE